MASSSTGRPTQNSSHDNDLAEFNRLLGPAHQQPLFHVDKQVDINGVEMGVLENGVPYLSEAGLARMCGIDRRVLNRLAANWLEERHKPRGLQITQLLQGTGYTEPALFLKSEHNGSAVNAYTEPVCMALLEYYAFVSEEKRPEAIHAFRSLARATFRQFVYNAVGYSPEQKALESWKHFHDRVDMTADAVPFGFFSVFREIAAMIVPMIRAGVIISDKVVPDISVGRAWSTHWTDNRLEAKFGVRCKYDHAYPEYYPQAKSNPQPSYAYPDAALGEFRSWLREHYIASKFPAYLLGQTKKGAVPQLLATSVLAALGHKEAKIAPAALPKPPQQRQ